MEENVRLDIKTDISELRLAVAELEKLRSTLGSLNRDLSGFNASQKADTQAYIASVKARAAEEKAASQAVIQGEREKQAAIRTSMLAYKQALQESGKDINAFKDTVRTTMTTIGTYFTVQAMVNFGKGIVDIQSKLEAFELSVKNLAGNKYGTKIFEDLKAFTVNSPFNFDETIKSSQQLIASMKAVGQSGQEISKNLVPTLEALGNIAAGLGGGDRMGRLVYAFTQVQAAGRLMGTELRQLNETGLPMTALLAEKLGIKVEDVAKRMKDGNVSFKDFKEAIMQAGGAVGMFGGQMDILANTLGGKINKAVESLQVGMANIGNVLSEPGKGIIDSFTSLINVLVGTEARAKFFLTVVKDITLAIVALKASTLAWVAIGKIKNLVMGEAILAMEAYTGVTIATTAAQTRATAAATAFNSALKMNPITAVVTALTALYVAYDLYTAASERAAEEEKKRTLALNEVNIAVAKTKTETLTYLGVLKSTTATTKEKTAAFVALKKEYPEELKWLTDLTIGEKEYNRIMKIVNKTLEERIALGRLEAAYSFNNQIISGKSQDLAALQSENSQLKARMAKGEVGVNIPGISYSLAVQYKANEKAINDLNNFLKAADAKQQTVIEAINKRTAQDIKKTKPTITPTGDPTKDTYNEMSSSEVQLRKELTALKGLEDTVDRKRDIAMKQFEVDKQHTIDTVKDRKKRADDIFKLEKKLKEDLLKLHHQEIKEENDKEEKLAKQKEDAAEKEMKLVQQYNGDLLRLRKELAALERDFEIDKAEREELLLAKNEEEKLEIQKKYTKLRYEARKKELDQIILATKLSMAIALQNGVSAESSHYKAIQKVQLEAQIQLQTLKSNHEKEMASIGDKAKKKEVESEQDKKKKILQERKELITSMSGLAKMGIENMLDSLESLDNEATKGLARSGREILKEFNKIESGFKGLQGSLKNIKAEKANGGTASLTSIIGLAQSAAQVIDASIDFVAKATSLFIESKWNKVIKANNKALEQLKKDYDKAIKDIEKSYIEGSNAIDKKRDEDIRKERDIEAERLSNLISDKNALKQINEEYLEDEARIYAQYNESLNSTDAARAEEARNTVDALMSDLQDKRNNEIVKLYETQEAKKRIEQEAAEKIAEIQATANERTVEETQKLIDDVNAKRKEDLEALKETLSEEERVRLETAEKVKAINEQAAADEFNLKTRTDAAKAEATKAYLQKQYEYELANFEANKKMQIALLKVERAKALAKLFTLGLFGLASGLTIGPITDAIKELEDSVPPPPPFFKGTDNTSEEKKKARQARDGRGGFYAILHPDEAVFSAKDMGEATAANGGKRPTRNEILDGFKIYKTMPTNYAINNTLKTKELENELQGLRKDFKDLAGAVQTRFEVNMDINGYHKYILKSGSKSRIINAKFSA